MVHETVMKKIRQFLPIQNPLTSFVHNNLLIAWEGFEFWEGSKKASEKYSAHFPKSPDFYQLEYGKGRISDESLLAAIRKHFSSENIWSPEPQEKSNDIEKILLKLLKECRRYPSEKFIKEGSHDTVNSEKVHALTVFPIPTLINDCIFPDVFKEWFCTLMESYLDQGLAYWHNPFSEEGILTYAKASLQARSFTNNSWEKRLYESLTLQSSETGLLEKLEQMASVDSKIWEEHLMLLAFCFKGWLGMVNKSETEAQQFPVRPIKASLEDSLALLVLAYPLFHHTNFPDSIFRSLAKETQDKKIVYLTEAQFKALLPSYPTLDFARLIEQLNTLDAFHTAKIWHEAYEDSLYRTAISAFSNTNKNLEVKSSDEEFAVLLCMDDREESFRRHLEELSPTLKTYGVLGNFNLDMQYLSVNSPKPRPHCPPVVTPRRTLYELVNNKQNEDGFKKPLFGFSRNWQEKLRATILLSGSSWIRGFTSSLFIGFASLAPLFTRVVFPQLGRKLSLLWQQIGIPDVDTHIVIDRSEHATYGPCGYTEEEQAEIVASVLLPLDIHQDWKPVVYALGHQATSENNPFQQAYGCGACSGNSGAANARIFAKMANAQKVRQILRNKFNYEIPVSTKFIACVHDTTQDLITYFHYKTENSIEQKIIKRSKKLMHLAAAKNSFERTRFFGNTPVSVTAKKALEHCYARSQSLAEPRPEYGHSRVAIAIFGPRQWTREMCFDRRAFLISYHPETDTKDHSQLRGLMHGAFPVVANIGLDYFFSSIDSHGFGSGSKLPLNISALVGVVSGSRGDLRVGLAHQMVELHEPVRPLGIFYSTKTAVFSLVQEHARLKRLVGNDWLRVIVFDLDEQKFFALNQWKWTEVDTQSTQSNSLYRWGNLNTISVGGPLDSGNSLSRWGTKSAESNHSIKQKQKSPKMHLKQEEVLL